MIRFLLQPVLTQRYYRRWGCMDKILPTLSVFRTFRCRR